VKRLLPLILLALFSSCSHPPPVERAAKIEEHRGIAYFLSFRDYDPQKVERELRRIASLGANWVSLDVALWQARFDSPEVALPMAKRYEHPVLKTVYRPDLWHHFPTDEEIEHFLNTAHGLGLKVMFKPHVHPEYTGMRVVRRGRGADPMWPGRVHMKDERDWRRWFESYGRVIEYYVGSFPFDAVCVGDELSGTYGRSREWRELISRVKAVRDIPVTCAFNWWVVVHHQKRFLVTLLRLFNLEDEVLRLMISKSGYKLEFDPGVLGQLASDTFAEYPDWTDALDWVGLNFYFPLSDKRDPSLQELREAWHRYRIPALIGEVEVSYVEGIRSWRDSIGKPLLFTEGGWGKWDYAAKYPGNWFVERRSNPELQARCYRAFFEEVYPLGIGAYFWDWAEPGFSPEGGPAEEVIREFWGKRRSEVETNGG